MRIYGLTTSGLAVCRNVRNADEPKFKILSYLYKVNRAELRRIADYIGVSPAETSRIIRRDLKNLVAEE